MKDMTRKQALEEATKRWGETAAVRSFPRATRKTAGTSRLARYRCTVGDGYLGDRCSIEGQGDTWREAFEDARPRCG